MAVTNIFAIYYVIAQIIERIVEVIKKSSKRYDTVHANIDTDEAEIANKKKIIEKELDKDVSERYNELRTLLKNQNNRNNGMVRDLFAISCILGILAAWQLNIRFLALLEVAVKPWHDFVITGLVVGSGTKPLHDLIKYIEKTKS